MANSEHSSKHTELEAYVDGSYTAGVTGYGVVLLENDNVIDELFGSVDPSEVNGTYQVAGELAAVKETLKWCQAHSVREISIFYDYLGIEKWAVGAWRAKQPLTQEYARFVRDSGIRIRWHKVGGHTGNRWNDRADELAKKGTGATSPAGGVASPTGGVAAPTGGADPLLAELLEKVDAWIEFLMVKGIDAEFDRIYNEQFARVIILRDDKSLGMFDLYNTKKKKLSPYMHNFRDEQLKLKIEEYWKEFLTSE